MTPPRPRPGLGYALKLLGAFVGLFAFGGLIFDLFIPDSATGRSAFGGVSILRTLAVGLLAIWIYGKGRAAESPTTHGTEAVARRDLQQIAERHRNLAMAMTEPSTFYASSTDEELVEVYGAIDKDAERFKELIAEIRRRVAT